MKPSQFDPNLTNDERAGQLLARMTLEEKAAQLQGMWTSDLLDAHREFDPAKAKVKMPHGIGHISRVGAVSMRKPTRSAELANAIQRFLVEETRLGIPGIVHEESCAGYLAKDATTFPQAIGQAATWMPDLIEDMATVIRKQMRSVGAHHALAPVLDVARDPRWGRTEETFGEDPFLISSIGGAYIRGMQGKDPTTGIIATAKHFVGYGLPVGGMNWAPALIPERELREVFITPFAAAIKLADVWSVMNGYQELDGIPCGSSTWLLRDILRGELGFQGVVVADYFTLNMFVDYHHLTDNKADAARFGLTAGIDVELPMADCYAQPLLDALNAGKVDVALIDEAVHRILRQKFDLGLFERPYVDGGAIAELYSDPAALELSRLIAEKSIILLKNDADLLPLSLALKRIAVIGPGANSARLLQGDYHYPAHVDGVVDLAGNIESLAPGEQGLVVNWADELPTTTTILAGIKAAVSADTEIYLAHGCDNLDPDDSGFAEAVRVAQAAEVAIVVVGDRSGLAIGSTSGEAIDRATLELSGIQQQLIQAVHATGTPTVVVLLNGRPPALTQIADRVPAILQAWLPGQEGGQAIADVLFGKANPGGKLPVTFPRSVGQTPIYYNHKPSGGRSHWHGEYVDESVKPLYPFGHGLSYTQFTYSHLHLSHQQAVAGDVISVEMTVTNTGQRAGDEIVQMYVADPIASVTRPVKQLKGFARVGLEPGQSATIRFDLAVRHLAFYDRDMAYVVEPGVINVMVGASSEDIRLTGAFEITGETTVVEPVYATSVTVEVI